YGKFLLEGDHSAMSLSKVLELCGMQDNRKAHNGLEDAKLTAECFSRLIYGKGLLPEYSQFELPGVLAK
ncbi:MAG TPA: hypothetical protein VI544_01540, partial [Candidatus Nanoarchaeia archaeon]|nr:hypothetical protein [Candidatus Nanoarchaeia archaeon]